MSTIDLLIVLSLTQQLDRFCHPLPGSVVVTQLSLEQDIVKHLLQICLQELAPLDVVVENCGDLLKRLSQDISDLLCQDRQQGVKVGCSFISGHIRQYGHTHSTSFVVPTTGQT